MPVDVKLRKHGAQSTKGRPAQVPNHRAARHAAREAARQQRAATERAELVIAGRSGVHLAEWPTVASGEEAAILWELLTAIMRTAPDAAGTRTALTGDDRWLVMAYPPPPGIPSAQMATPDGDIACENWRIEITRA